MILVDLTAPTIENLGTVSVACGADFSPEAVGRPQVTDNRDVNPEVTYEDKPNDGCVMERTWTAQDAAMNVATMTQVGFFVVVVVSLNYVLKY